METRDERGHRGGLGCGNGFFDITAKLSVFMREITGNLGYLQPFQISSLRDTIKRIRGQTTDEEKILAKDMSD